MGTQYRPRQNDKGNGSFSYRFHSFDARLSLLVAESNSPTSLLDYFNLSCLYKNLISFWAQYTDLQKGKKINKQSHEIIN